ncbi:MAG: DUF2380 domain-containing protein [Candidatus Marinimicrobia bacterium]|nr:DUF2380 domain-containing protein [Candidatus Neomarinimicrobiota bacterium]
MKPLSSAALLGCVLTLLVWPLKAQMVTIAVLDFDGIGIAETEAIALSNRLRNELFRLGRFEVVDRGMMTEILNEQDFQQSGCTSNDCLVEVGRLLGARQMIGGSVSKVGGTFTVSARLVDVETSRVLAVSDFDLRGEVDDMLTRGMAQVAIQLSISTVGINVAPQQAGAETVTDNAASETATDDGTPPTATMTPTLKHNKFKITAGIPVGWGSGYNVAFGWRPFRSRQLGPLVVTPALSAGFLAFINYNNNFGGDQIYFLAETSAEIALGRLGLGLHAGLGGGNATEWEINDRGDIYRSNNGGPVISLGASISVQLGRINIALQPGIIAGNGFGISVLNIEIR